MSPPSCNLKTPFTPKDQKYRHVTETKLFKNNLVSITCKMPYTCMVVRLIAKQSYFWWTFTNSWDWWHLSFGFLNKNLISSSPYVYLTLVRYQYVYWFWSNCNVISISYRIGDFLQVLGYMTFDLLNPKYNQFIFTCLYLSQVW